MLRRMSARCTLILLPGLLCDRAVWAAQLETLAGAVVPSYGTLASITAMAEHVLAQVPAGPLALAGHSMGGRVALEMLRLAPRRVQRLALLDSGMDPLPDGDAGAAERAQRLALLAQARAQGMRAMGRAWARGMVHPARLDTPFFDALLDMIERQTPQVFDAQVQALLGRPDARGLLPRISCPTLLLCGRQDAWSPLARHQRMQALLPGSRLVVVEDAGHMTTMEQPAAVSAALHEWLEWTTSNAC
jgi:pimeloyl-ACP methyl ester carboxylesterase